MDLEVTQEMVEMAQGQENAIANHSPDILAAQVGHLNQRVVLLRALTNRQESRIDELEQENEKLKEEVKGLKARRRSGK